MSFTAVMIYYDEYDAVINSLRILKKYNANCEIILGRDTLDIENPDQFKEYCNKFIKSRSCMQEFYNYTKMGKNTAEISLDTRFDLLFCSVSRLGEAARISKYKKILYMEPDVIVRKLLDTNNKYDMDTLDKNKYNHNFIKLVNSFSESKLNFDGWGYCTGLATTSGFIEVENWVNKNHDIVNKLLVADYRMAYADFAFPILFHLIGMSVGNSKMITECKSDRFWRFNRKPIVHQYRKKYLIDLRK
jgi:hypothetical protein